MPPRPAAVRELFRAAYDLYTRHSAQEILTGVIDDDTLYWESVMHDITRVTRAHNNDRFLVGVCVEIVRELETEYREIMQERRHSNERAEKAF